MLGRRGPLPALLRAGFAAVLLGAAAPAHALFLSAEDEQRIGDSEHPKLVRQFGGAYGEPGLNAYVTGLGNFLASTAAHRDRVWTFTILDNPEVNAFALPGGYVYVTRGFLALANSEAELAAVIGHEIGHVAARHAAERNTRGAVAGIAGLLLDNVVGDRAGRLLLQLGSEGVLARYSQQDELEADTLGIRYMRRAGFDTGAAARILRSLGRASELRARVAGRPAPGGGFFASHPRTIDRVHEAMRLAGGALAGGPPIVGREVYLDQIDGLPFGEKVREGVVRDGSYLHPVLGFAFTAPPGFRYDNQPDQVLAFGQDGTVIVLDGFSPGWREFRDFLRRDDLDRQEFSVNGMPAVTGIRRNVEVEGRRFDQRTVLILWEEGWVWRLRFLTPPARTLARDRDLLRVTHSFRRLGPGERDLRQRRIRVVEVGPGDTAAALARRMEVDAEPEAWFRVLNGLADGESPEPGTRVKIVAH